LTKSERRPPRLLRNLPARPGAQVLSTDRARWSLSASTNPNLMRLAVDGNLSTRWHSLQRPEEFFQLDLGRETAINGIILDDSGQYSRDWPRGFRVDVSRDGLSWSTVAQNPAYLLPLSEFLRPRGHKVDIAFAATTARHVRVVLTASDADYRWSVNEINVTVPTPTESSALAR
jgi:hypothetical protein